MTWTKTSDDFPERMFDLSSDAYRLHHAATTFANRLLLDGRIPKPRLAMAPVPPKVRRRAVIQELIDAQLWRDDGEAWTLTDFLSVQPTREEVETERAYNAVRQRLRFARAAVKKRETPPVPVKELQEEERLARARFNAAREHHRVLISQRESPRKSPGDRHRPDPSRPYEDEDEGRTQGPEPSVAVESVSPDIVRALTDLDRRNAPFGERMAAAGYNADELKQPWRRHGRDVVPHRRRANPFN